MFIYFFLFPLLLFLSFFSLTIIRQLKKASFKCQKCHLGCWKMSLGFYKKNPGCCSSSGCSTTELLHSTFGSKRPSKSFPAGSRQPLYRRRAAAGGSGWRAGATRAAEGGSIGGAGVGGYIVWWNLRKGSVARARAVSPAAAAAVWTLAARCAAVSGLAAKYFHIKS